MTSYCLLIGFLVLQGVRYTASRDSGECRKEDLRESFTPIGIPSNATFLTEFYLGSSGDESEGVLVELWVGNTTNPMGIYIYKHCYVYIV